MSPGKRVPMQYIRISLLTPRAGQGHEVTRLISQIIALCTGRDGFRGGLIIGGGGEAGRLVGRVTLWDDRASADRVACEEHMLALRSRLDGLVLEERRAEYGLDAVQLSAEPGGPAGISGREAIAIAEGLVRAPRLATGPQATEAQPTEG